MRRFLPSVLSGFFLSSMSCGARVLAVATLVAVSAPGVAQAQPNHQSCGKIPECSGPVTYTDMSGMVIFSFIHAPTCDCTPTATNAYGCSTGSGIIAVFNLATNTAAMGCDFDCPGKGQCSIRGDDGLPVELMHFGVE